MILRKIFFALIVMGGLASCTKDVSCTCTTDAYELLGVTVEASSTTTTCEGCNKSEREDFEQACSDSDAELQIAGEGIPGFNASCTLD